MQKASLMMITNIVLCVQLNQYKGQMYRLHCLPERI